MSESTYAVTTLDEFVALMRARVKTPPDAVNEGDLREWCFQRWHGGNRKGGYADSTVSAFAKEYDRYVGRGLRGGDRRRKPGPKDE